MPKSLCRRVIYWYHFYLNHPSVSRLEKTIRELFYLKGLFTQAELFAKTCKTCQQFKKRKTLYRQLSPNNIAFIKPWDLVHIDLIGPYTKSIRQHHTGGAIIWNNASLTCMTMIEPATGWFEIFKISTFDLGEVASGSDE